MPAHTEWTVEMLDALPDDGQRHEIIDGELFVSPSPARRHQLVLAALFQRLSSYLMGAKVARALFAPADVRRGRRTSVQPDILVPRFDVLRASEGAFAFGDLLLVVEALSPSTSRVDWHVKRPLYQRERIPEYWLVDIDARSIARWLPDDAQPTLFADAITWHPVGMPAPLVIDVPEMFREALEG